MRLTLLLVVLVPFLVWSTGIAVHEGYFGFIGMAMRERWGLQVSIDLAIALTLFVVWMLPDARQRGLPGWLYLILTVTLGSIGALSYLVHREIAAKRAVQAG